MTGTKTSLFCAIALLLASATGSFAYGTIKGQLPPEREPMACAVFIYTMEKPPTSPYAVPFFAAPCKPDGSFSIILPEGRYLVGSGISIGGAAYAVHPDAQRRLPLDGPQAQIFTLKENSVHVISAKITTKEPVQSSSHRAETQLVTLTGTVRDGTGAPVSLAVVTLLEPASTQNGRNRIYMSAPTDGEGRFSIEQVKPQTYRLEAVKVSGDGFMKGEMPEIDLAAPHNPLRYDIIVYPPAPSVPAPQKVQEPVAPAVIPPQGLPIAAPVVDPTSL